MADDYDEHDYWDYEPKTSPEIADLFQIEVDLTAGVGYVMFAGVVVYHAKGIPRHDGERLAKYRVASSFAAKLSEVMQ